MNWIRMATTMKGDPSVHAIAAACCKGDVPKAIGHLQCLFSEMPAHAADGNLKGVSPLTLEQWALWAGKRGAFDSAIRTTLCDGDVMRAWDRYNGSAIREAKRNADSMRRYRNRDRNVGGNVGTHVGTHVGPNVHNDVTERDVTERDVVAVPVSCVAKKPLAISPRVPTPRGRDGLTPIGTIAARLTRTDSEGAA